MRSYSAAAARVEHRFDPRRPFLVALALPARRFQVADGRRSRGADCRRQRSREDETGRIGAHGVHHLLACRDVAAQTAERLRQGALDTRSQMPPPRGPYMPTACTSSQ